MKAGWRLSGLTALVVLACGEFAVDPDRDLRDARAEFHLFATLNHPTEEGGEATWFIRSVVQPGIVRGLANAFLDSLLHIDGDGLPPLSPRPADLSLFYQTQLQVALDSMHTAELTVTPPTMQNTPSVFIKFSAFGRSSSDTIRLVSDEDLIVPVIPPARPPVPAPLSLRWVLIVVDSSGSMINLHAFTDPPDPLVIPRDLLPASTPLTVTFNFQFSGQAVDNDTLIATRYSIAGSHNWIVEIE